MKKEFINPELEVLRFQKGADVLLTSESLEVKPGDGSGGSADGSKSLSRGFFDNSVD